VSKIIDFPISDKEKNQQEVMEFAQKFDDLVLEMIDKNFNPAILLSVVSHRLAHFVKLTTTPEPLREALINILERYK
jgi:hypothetical protein